MNPSNTVLVVSSDTVSGLGLRTLLVEHFGLRASYVPSWKELSLHDLRTRDFLIILCDSSSLREAPANLLKSFRAKLVLFGRKNDAAHTPYIDIDAPFDRLQAAISNLLPAEPGDADRKSNVLTAREIEVLKLLAQGYINKEIAAQLSISVHTVISHRNNISEKLGIKTVPGLTVYATINGYISTDAVI